MKRRIIGSLLLAATISGCVNVDQGPETGGVRPHYGRVPGPPTVPGLEGPYGTKVGMIGPYDMAPPANAQQAAWAMSANIPANAVQMNSMGGPMGGPLGTGMPALRPPGNMLLSPPGMPPVPGMMPPGMGPVPGMAPPGASSGPGMMPPGMPPMPGMMPPGLPGMTPPGNPFQKVSMSSTMPDPGVMNANVPPGAPSEGVKPAQFASSSPVSSLFPSQRTQVFFTNPARMNVYWYTQGADGKPSYSTTPLEVPGRYNFAQSAIYRLKLTKIPGRPGLELYPTLEVVPTGPKTNEFLAHNSVPIDFTEEDFKQVVDRNYIVKVIYLPDAQYQDATGAGPGEITSAQLQPGQDPIQEALRRGSILLVLRIGNIDQGLQHSPEMTSPVPGGAPPLLKVPGGAPPLMQVPYLNPPGPNPANPGPPISPGLGEAPKALPTTPLFQVPNIPAPPATKTNEEKKPEAPKPPVIPPENKVNEATKPPVIPPENKANEAPKPPVIPPENKANEAPKPPVIPQPPVIPPENKVNEAPKLPVIPKLPVTPPETKNVGPDATMTAPSIPSVPVVPVGSTSKENSPSTPPIPSIDLPPIAPVPAKTEETKSPSPSASGTGAKTSEKAPPLPTSLPGLPSVPPVDANVTGLPELPPIPTLPEQPGKK